MNFYDLLVFIALLFIALFVGAAMAKRFMLQGFRMGRMTQDKAPDVTREAQGKGGQPLLDEVDVFDRATERITDDPDIPESIRS